MSLRQATEDLRQRLHAADMMIGIIEYREACKKRGEKPKKVWGVYNQKDSLVYWSLAKRTAEAHADKIRWDDAVITVKEV